MELLNALETADFSTASTAAVKKPSAVRNAFAALSTMIASSRKASAERHLRAELAEMDETLLRDIGVADDEIYLIRSGEVFTPRAWTRNPGGRAWTA
jgi:uncharacterized protein YjiS (DUF1127 family)